MAKFKIGEVVRSNHDIEGKKLMTVHRYNTHGLYNELYDKPKVSCMYYNSNGDKQYEEYEEEELTLMSDDNLFWIYIKRKFSGCISTIVSFFTSFFAKRM